MAMFVNHSQAANLIRTCGTSNTFLLRGQPGIGKSAILETLRPHMPDYNFCYIDVANLDLGDLGMPVIDRERMVTNYAPNARFGIGAGQHKPIVLMLDELGKASRPVLNMLLPVILEQRIADVRLPVGSVVFATTNLDTDGVGDNIPAHAYNRMTELVMANPTADEWLAWAGDNDIAPETMAFVKQTPEVLDCYATTGTDSKNPYIFNPRTGNVRTYCSPRSLAKSSNLVRSRSVLGEGFLPALAGTIGEPAARQMEALINLADSLPLYETIIKSPDTAKVPESVGALFILAFMMAGRATAETMTPTMQYMQRIADVSFEAHATFITTLASNSAKVTMACRNREFTKAAAALGKYF